MCLIDLNGKGPHGPGECRECDNLINARDSVPRITGRCDIFIVHPRLIDAYRLGDDEAQAA